MIALTYDDGPNPNHTEAVMDCLERFGAQGTFFVIGAWAEREPALIREIVDRGHALGNHTFAHPRLDRLPTAEQVREELRKCRDAVESAGVTFSKLNGKHLMRPPFGAHNPAALQAIRDEGYVPVFWSVKCFDWNTDLPASFIAGKALTASDGDIVLLHDGSHPEFAGNRAATVSATEEALQAFTANGYGLVTVPVLQASRSSA